MVILDLKTKIHACRWCIFWSSEGVFEHYKKDFCDQYREREIFAYLAWLKNDFCEQYENAPKHASQI